MASCGSMKQRGMTEVNGTGCVGRHNGAVAGRYESWFLSARDAEPGRPARAVWIRHTRHRGPDDEQGTAALWCTVFDPAAGAPAAVKQSVATFGSGVAASAAGF